MYYNNKYANITFQVKYRSDLVVRLKAIKSKQISSAIDLFIHIVAFFDILSLYYLFITLSSC